jgi:hypothetical protein
MVATIEAVESGRGAAGLVVRVDLVEGAFDAPCEICGLRPTAMVVRLWEAEPGAPQDAGAFGPIERHPFCVRHKSAAAALYQMFTR